MSGTREQNAARQREWRSRNVEKCREACRKRRAARTPDQIERDKAANKKWHETHARPSKPYNDARHDSYLLRKYDVSKGQYALMLTRQGGTCAICQNNCTTGRRLAVDHCHASGKVRGLLCRSCNVALGALNDRPELLRRAADYLETCAL